MSGGLFADADAAPKESKEERRTKLYPYDSVAALMLEPYGESALDTMSLAQVWSGTVKGNKRCAYHSHLAASQQADPWHVGAGVSLTAAAMLAAIKNFKSSDMQKIIVPTLYQKVMDEIKTLEPVLQALNFGRGSATATASSSFRDAKRLKTTASTPVTGASGAMNPDQAAKAFRAWLATEKSPLRSMLFILSANNTFYTGHTAELVARAAVVCKPMSEDDFVAAVRARCQQPADKPDVPGAASSDATGLFDA